MLQFQTEALKRVQILEEIKADWIRTVRLAQPTLRANYAQGLCDDIVNRGQIICMTGPVEPLKVVSFLLSRTRAWVLGGFPVHKIAERLPKNLDELGTFIITENVNPMTGKKLTGKELKEASLKGKHYIQ